MGAVVESPSIVPGSLPLRNARHEAYAKARALNMPPRAAAIEAGLKVETGAPTKLENNAKIQLRMAWFARQDDEVLRAKRAKLEAFLWAVHESNYGDFWEVVEEDILDEDGEATGEKRRMQRLKMFSDMPPEQQKMIESLKYTEKGRPVLALYSAMQANIELRKLNMIGTAVARDGDGDDYGRLTDKELVEAIANQARELGRYDQLFASIGGATQNGS